PRLLSACSSAVCSSDLTPLLLRRLAAAFIRSDMAGLFGRPLGTAGACPWQSNGPQRSNWPAEGDHDSTSSRIYAEERRALWFKRCLHRILSASGGQRRSGIPCRDDDARRSAVPAATLRQDVSVQETARRSGLAANTLHCAVSGFCFVIRRMQRKPRPQRA